MRPRKGVFVFVVMMLVGSVLLLAPVASADSHPVECNKDYVKVYGKTIKVLPTGVDDTENLQCALDKAETMPWARIKLVAGKYTTGFLEAADLFVKIVGAGMGKTIISTPEKGLDCIARVVETGEYPALLTLARSKVTYKGLTFAVGGEAPCMAAWDGFVDDEGFGFEDWSMDAVVSTDRLRGDEACPGPVHHRLRAYSVAIASEFPDPFAPVTVFENFGGGIVVKRFGFDRTTCMDSWMIGEVTVRNSHFTGTGASVFVNFAEDSKITVGGKKMWQRNSFDSVGFGVRVANNNNTHTLIKGNHINDVHWWGVYASSDEDFDLTGDEPSSIVISKNKIRGVAWADGVGVEDLGPETVGYPLFDAAIWYNDIEMVETPFNGIIAIGTDGKIKGNRISGSSFSGVMVDGIAFDYDEDEIPDFVYPSSGWHVAKNNLKGFEPFFADIVLWPPTEDNTVMCMHLTDEVVDLGVDNVLIGCTEIDPPPPPGDEAMVATPQRLLREKALPGRYGALLER